MRGAISDRLDGWVRSRSALDRLCVVGEAAVALLTLLVIAAIVWRVVDPGAPAVVIALTSNWVLAALGGYLAASLAVRRFPRLAAHDELTRALSDETLTALSTTSREDFDAVVTGAVADVDVEGALREAFEDERFGDTVDELVQRLADEVMDDDDLASEVLDSVLDALGKPEHVETLSGYLARLLSEEKDVIDGIGRPVTKKLGGRGFFGDFTPSSGDLRSKVRKFLRRPKGRRWAADTIRQVLADIRRVPSRAVPVRETLGRPIIGAATGRLGRALAPRLGEHLAESQGIGADLTDKVQSTVQPALLGALDHVVDHRAAEAVQGIDHARAARHIARAGAVGARRLQCAGFLAGAALGALPLWWG